MYSLAIWLVCLTVGNYYHAQVSLNLPTGAVGLATAGQVTVGSFSRRSMSAIAFLHWRDSPAPDVQAVGSLALRITAAMQNCMSARDGRLGAAAKWLPSSRRGHIGSAHPGGLGKNSPVCCRMRIPGQAEFCVASES